MHYNKQLITEEMGIRKYPEYLYHYTSIESLALILKSSKLRFSRLDCVNDPLEAKASDIERAETTVFVSCWTSQHVESIPLWRMYTKNMDGVRIKMPIDLFEGRRMPDYHDDGGAITYLHLKSYTIRRKDYDSTGNGAIVGPNKIFYTNDAKYYDLKCIGETEWKGRTIKVFEPYDLGMFKRVEWEFEQEWRYKITYYMYPGLLLDEESLRPNELDFVNNEILDGFVDVPLDPSALKEIEVTLGPLASEAEHTLVESILKTYIGSVNIHKSNITIRKL